MRWKPTKGECPLTTHRDALLGLRSMPALGGLRPFKTRLSNGRYPPIADDGVAPDANLTIRVGCVRT